MYRINVESCGKYHNVTPGFRYCIGKKKALYFINVMNEFECEYTVEKFVRLTRRMWAWSEDEALFSLPLFEDEEEEE